MSGLSMAVLACVAVIVVLGIVRSERAHYRRPLPGIENDTFCEAHKLIYLVYRAEGMTATDAFERAFLVLRAAQRGGPPTPEDHDYTVQCIRPTGALIALRDAGRPRGLHVIDGGTDMDDAS